ncbi:MAG: diaminopimelate decarboxylase [Candidatus Krumholzibacteria bacterium]
MSFYYKKNYLHCERLKVKAIQKRVPESPFYLYSLAQLTDNYQAYASALQGVPSIISYAFKANSNLTLLRHLRELGSGAVLVSGNELELALTAGFDPAAIVFNGNGKTMPELRLAAGHGVLINVDSEFDLGHIEQAAVSAGKPVRVLIRINPDLDPGVHPHVSTGIRDSKFGIGSKHLPRVLDRIKASRFVDLVGVQCHLGSTIKDVEVFRDATALMMKVLEDVRQRGFDAKYLNIGGGLGIDYGGQQRMPKPSDLVECVRQVLSDDVTVIVEPGRSIVGSAGILVSRVIGVKSNGNKQFIVTDASMAELIRPSLYEAYHRIEFIEPVDGPRDTFDVVGPVCESGDFLGRDRELATPGEDAGVAIHDAGAYGYAMSSNYNARLRPAEYLVDGDRLTRIRRAERLEDYMRLFEAGDRTAGE